MSTPPQLWPSALCVERLVYEPEPAGGTTVFTGRSVGSFQHRWKQLGIAARGSSTSGAKAAARVCPPSRQAWRVERPDRVFTQHWEAPKTRHVDRKRLAELLAVDATLTRVGNDVRVGLRL